MLKVGDEIVVRTNGVSIRSMPASSDWITTMAIPLPSGSCGKVVGFSTPVVGERRYVLIEINGVVGHVAENSIELRQ